MIRTTKRLSGDSCGCAMGAKFLGGGLVGSLGWYGWQWHVHALTAGAACWRIVVVSFGAAVVGKFAGIARFRMRGRQKAAARFASYLLRSNHTRKADPEAMAH